MSAVKRHFIRWLQKIEEVRPKKNPNNWCSIIAIPKLSRKFSVAFGVGLRPTKRFLVSRFSKFKDTIDVKYADRWYRIEKAPLAKISQFI